VITSRGSTACAVGVPALPGAAVGCGYRYGSAGSLVPAGLTAAVTAPGPASGAWAGRAPGLAAGIPAPGYFRMLTARATIRATVTMEMADCRVMASLAQRDSGITSVGLNAAALVKAR
jgi:hypothetical protein